MPAHPYTNLPSHCFWHASVATPVADELDPVVCGKFKISRTDRVVTAGSCFAQHLARHLSKNGFSHFITETAHPLFTTHLIENYCYGIFSARYGNVYTSRQLVQLLARAYGQFQPQEDIWISQNGRFIDPYRPRIQPNGFSSKTEYYRDRAQHFAAVRRAFEELDVFVFTLGLTEAWVSRFDGAVFPLCPGVAGGEFDRDRHALVNLSVADVTRDLHQVIGLIRERNPCCKMVLTVSPVPLAATAVDRSVLASTTYSKSVLRVAAEEVSQDLDYVAYFPSYEVITGAHARGRYFAQDLRSVTEAGVNHVMRLFLKHYTLNAESSALTERSKDQLLSEKVRQHDIDMRQIARAICEEELLDSSARAMPP